MSSDSESFNAGCVVSFAMVLLFVIGLVLGFILAQRVTFN